MDTQLDMHNRVTGEQLERILKLQLETLAKRPEMAKMLPPLMVWGAPGLGKSSILQKAARGRLRATRGSVSSTYASPSASPWTSADCPCRGRTA